MMEICVKYRMRAEIEEMCLTWQGQGRFYR